MAHSFRESKLQQSCVRWFKYAYPKVVIFAIPNEGRRNKANASRMKAEGMLAGVADLFIAIPTGNYSGLFIELKTTSGRQMPSQRDFQENVTMVGYQYKICRNFDEFKAVVECYFVL